MSKTTLNLCFSGPGANVEIYSDGRLVIHKSTNKTGARSYLLSSSGGNHQLNTLHQLNVEVVSGPLTIKAEKGASKEFAGKGKLTLPAGSAFTIDSAGPAILRLSPKPGPGFGGPGSSGCVLD